MNKKQRKMLIRIIISALLVAALMLFPVSNSYLEFALYMVAYLIIGYDILLKAWKGILNKQVFDENFLMAVATVGALAIAIYERLQIAGAAAGHGEGGYTEAVAVMLFYQIGEWFQSYAVGKSRRNISELMDIRPDYANIERDGSWKRQTLMKWK